LPFSPLGRGFLTGKLSQDEIKPGDFRATLPRFQGENFDRNKRIVEEVEAIAKRHNATTGQVALAWVLAQGDGVVPIPGTKHINYLEENVAAANLRLSDGDLAQLERISEPAGARYAAT
ncbi:MAG: aldo/keto reductase, partial [Candidatus Eremiobacteraeota bacterium]|nr:aldo/keto reductase [Candidatus Eremiobacteraeota bacterium]